MIEKNRAVSYNPNTEVQAAGAEQKNAHTNDQASKYQDIEGTLTFARLCALDAKPEEQYRISIRDKKSGKDIKISCTQLKKDCMVLNKIAGLTGDVRLLPYQLNRYIKEKWNDFPLTYLIARTGFDRISGEPDGLIYKFNRVFGADVKFQLTGASQRMGEHGNLGAIVNLANKYVVNNPRLSLAMILGLYGAALDFVQQRGCDNADCDMRINVNFYGDSSIGKSSLSYLPLSAAGKPNELMNSFNTTDIRLNQQQIESGSMAFVVDDIKQTRSNSGKMVELIFSLADGKARERYTSKSETVPPRATGALIMTTETSLIGELSRAAGKTQVKGHGGRLIEIACCAKDLFESREDCESFVNTLNANYGTWGATVIQYMLSSFGGERISSAAKSYEERIAEKLSDSPIGGRFVKRIALALTTGEIINEALGIAMDLSAVENLLIESVVRSLKTITESPTSKEHYRMLYTYVQDNMKDFVNTVEQVSDATPGHGEGELNPKYMALEEDGILFIRAPQLKTLLGEGFRQTLREWERLEILLDTSQDGKRRAVKKSTQCGRQEFYVIVMDARFLVGGDSNA